MFLKINISKLEIHLVILFINSIRNSNPSMSRLLRVLISEGRFGSLKFIGGQQISSFQEKPKGDGTWINGGFFVCESKVFDYIKEGDKTIFERQPLEDLTKDGELFAYKHSGFWKPMDTLRDNKVLNSLWDKNEAKWKLWK